MWRMAGVLLLAVVPTFAGSGTLAMRSDEREFPAAPRVSREEPAWTAPARYSAIVTSSAAEAGVPAWILARVLEAESSWRADAVGGVNADGSRDLGIAQLGERWMDDFVWFDNAGTAFDPFDPGEAIPVAARYLARLYAASGTWRTAVAAYNCGLARAKTGSLPAKTADYVALVFQGQIVE
jgi:soluble lytic murein transglycosylase-like protein